MALRARNVRRATDAAHCALPKKTAGAFAETASSLRPLGTAAWPVSWGSEVDACVACLRGWHGTRLVRS